MRKIKLTILVIMFFSLTVLGQNDLLKKIENIRPLFTTEKEVEKIFGKAVERYSFIGKYETKEGIFTVYYSEGKCSPSWTPKYNVEKGIVIQYNFRPKKKIKFATLKIDISGLETGTVREMSPSPITYYNPDKGVDYTVLNGLINFVQVYQPRDLKYLQCSE